MKIKDALWFTGAFVTDKKLRRAVLWAVAPKQAQQRFMEAVYPYNEFGSSWIPIAGGTDSTDNPAIRRDAVTASRYYSQSSPIYGRAIRLTGNYIFGRGVIVQAVDKRTDETPEAEVTVEDVVKDFQADLDNRLITRADGQRKLSRIFFTDGELFPVFFVNRGNGHVKIGLVKTEEITEIITDNNDVESPEYYQREYYQRAWDWTAKQYTGLRHVTDYYPDWTQGNTEHSSVAPNVSMTYYRNDNEGDRGLPPFYSGISSVKIHQGRMLDWARLLVAAATFAFKAKSAGNASQLEKVAQLWDGYTAGKHGSTTGNFETAEGAQTIFENNAFELSQFNFSLPAGEWDTAIQTIVFQISAATDITYANLTGDSRNGNLASMSAMDGPQQKGFEAWQKFFEDMLSDIYNFVVEQAIRHGRLDPHTPDGRPRDLTVRVKMPPIVVNDLATVVSAVATVVNMQATIGRELFPRERLVAELARAFGVDDVAAVLSELDDEIAQSILPTLPDEEADKIANIKEQLRAML